MVLESAGFSKGGRGVGRCEKRRRRGWEKGKR
jgi:hypothetical protein